MNQKDANAIRQAAEWLSYQSVSSSGDSQASITKADLDNFKAKIVQTTLAGGWTSPSFWFSC